MTNVRKAGGEPEQRGRKGQIYWEDNAGGGSGYARDKYPGKG